MHSARAAGKCTYRAVARRVSYGLGVDDLPPPVTPPGASDPDQARKVVRRIVGFVLVIIGSAGVIDGFGKHHWVTVAVGLIFLGVGSALLASWYLGRGSVTRR